MKFRITNSKVYTNFRNYLIENKINFSIDCLPCGVADFDVKTEPYQEYRVKQMFNKFEIESLNNISIQGLTVDEYISINKLERA